MRIRIAPKPEPRFRTTRKNCDAEIALAVNSFNEGVPELRNRVVSEVKLHFATARLDPHFIAVAVTNEVKPLIHLFHTTICDWIAASLDGFRAELDFCAIFDATGDSPERPQDLLKSIRLTR
jgi:hypothetical protein